LKAIAIQAWNQIKLTADIERYIFTLAINIMHDKRKGSTTRQNANASRKKNPTQDQSCHFH